MTKEIYDPKKPFNEKIRELIRSTQPENGPIRVKQFGKRFAVERDAEYWKDYIELTGSDTVGTKGLLHWQMNTMEYAAQDAFAMVVDDLIEGGFVPAILQNQILMQEEDERRILDVVEGLTKLCLQNRWKHGEGDSPIIISGGETAPVNIIRGLEVGVTASGYVKKGDEIRQNALEGDVIIGVESSGIHSNGLSFFRNELFDKMKMPLSKEMPWGKTIGEELTIPTNVYLPAIKELIEGLEMDKGVRANRAIHGMVHITGGGFSKIRELDPTKGLDMEIAHGKLKVHEIFRYAHDELGMDSGRMYTRFNNGVGYAMAVDPAFVDYSLGILRGRFKAEEIGRTRRGTGRISIKSQFDSSTVECR